MSLIHYSLAPLILFRVSYMIDFLPYYLLIANGTGSVGVFELLIFQGFLEAIELIVRQLMYYTF